MRTKTLKKRHFVVSQINTTAEEGVSYKEEICRSNRKPGLTFVPTRCEIHHKK